MPPALRFLFAELRGRPAPDRARQCAPDIVGQAHGLGHFAQRRAAAIADDSGGQRGALGAVFVVDVLDDHFALLMLEVDVDVGRLVSFLGDETLEKRVDPLRSHLGDADAEADDRIGGGAPPLAEDVLAAGVFDDVVDGQEIARVVQALDQGEFFLDALRHGGGDTRRIARRRSLSCQPFEFSLWPETRFRRLIGIVVLEVAEGKGQLPGKEQGFRQRLRMAAKQAEPSPPAASNGARHSPPAPVPPRRQER